MERFGLPRTWKNINGELVKNAIEGASEKNKVRTLINKPINLLRVDTLSFSMAGISRYKWFNSDN